MGFGVRVMDWRERWESSVWRKRGVGDVKALENERRCIFRGELWRVSEKLDEWR